MKEEEKSFPIAGFVVGGIGILLGILYFLPHDKGLNKLLGIGIFVVGGIIGSVVENYLKETGFFGDND
ncbi:MAG: hypothetical protein A2W85_18150 [Bacteroidetes bacterium GWF2_41_31]|nr:MAG: hypothetical protein A2W85_18150 [Bacteroidetes bacterium GWF2_41_31]